MLWKPSFITSFCQPVCFVKEKKKSVSNEKVEIYVRLREYIYKYFDGRDSQKKTKNHSKNVPFT